jgi:hypothetical protein
LFDKDSNKPVYLMNIQFVAFELLILYPTGLPESVSIHIRLAHRTYQVLFW